MSNNFIYLFCKYYDPQNFYVPLPNSSVYITLLRSIEVFVYFFITGISIFEAVDKVEKAFSFLATMQCKSNKQTCFALPTTLTFYSSFPEYLPTFANLNTQNFLSRVLLLSLLSLYVLFLILLEI